MKVSSGSPSRRQAEQQPSVRADDTVILIILLAFFIVGVVTGCVLWSRTFTAEDTRTLCAAFVSPASWSEARAAVLSRAGAIGLFAGLLFLSSFFTFGWLVVPVVVFTFGLGFGVELCSLLDAREFVQALPSLAAFAVPAAISVPLLVLLARDCVRAAGSIAFSRGAFSGGEKPYLKLLVHLPLYIGSAFVYAGVQTALCRLLG